MIYWVTIKKNLIKKIKNFKCNIRVPRDRTSCTHTSGLCFYIYIYIYIYDLKIMKFILCSQEQQLVLSMIFRIWVECHYGGFPSIIVFIILFHLHQAVQAVYISTEAYYHCYYYYLIYILFFLNYYLIYILLSLLN